MCLCLFIEFKDLRHAQTTVGAAVVVWWWYVFSRRTSQLCFCKGSSSSQLQKRENAETKLRKDKVLPRLTQQHRNAHTHQTVLRLQLGRLIGRLIYFHGTSAAADGRKRKKELLYEDQRSSAQPVGLQPVAQPLSC